MEPFSGAFPTIKAFQIMLKGSNTNPNYMVMYKASI